jgi:hypothetical protein
MTAYQYLTVYDDLDVPLDGVGTTTCSTNPAHTRPYLIHVYETGESTVDFLEGRSTIGQINIRVLDKRVTANDQTTGWLTALLADSGGENRLAGRRITLDMRDGAGALLFGIFDGVINEISLDSDDVTYTIVTRDVRENERAQPLFNVTNGSTSIHPPGITNGYGTHVVRSIPTQTIAPAAVIGGTYTSFSDVNGGQVKLDKSAQSITPEMYNDWYAALNQTSQRFDSSGASIGFCYPNVIVRWRDETTHGAWHTFTNMPVPTGIFRNVFETDSQIYEIDVNSPNFLKLVMSSYDLVRMFSDGTGTFTLPANNQRVEIQVLSNLPPSELYPFWWDGNMGQLLKNIYDGLYSYTNPKIRYNAAAMTAFIAQAPNAKLRLTEIVEDMRPWVEENIYKPLGYAPAVNSAGEIVPVSMFLPDVSVTPVNLDDTNCKKAAWKHTSSDSVTKVTWRWKMEVVTGNPIPTFYKPPVPIVAVIKESDRQDIYLSASAVYVGTKEVTYEPATLKDLSNGEFDGSQTTNAARQAQKISRALIDRLRFGGQHIMVTGALRSAANIAALKVGDWCICGFSNLPDYGSHKRGMSRLAQIISIKDTDPISRDIELLDSGPSGAPLSTPTLGTVTVSVQTVSVPVTAVAGAEVAIDYALSVSQPATGSPLWQRAARGGTGTYKLPTLPVGTSVWVRARSEAVSKRPSAYTTAQNVTTTDVAYPTLVDVTINSTQHAIVTWTPNGAMLGARVYYAITPFNGTVPGSLSTFFDVDASLGTKDLGVTKFGDTITVDVEGWTGWTGSAVSGTQGRKARWQITRPVTSNIMLFCRATQVSSTPSQVVIRVTVADPLPSADISIAYTSTGVGTISPSSPQTILAANVTDNIGTTGFVDFTIDKGAGTTGRVTFTATSLAKLADTESVEIPSSRVVSGGAVPSLSNVDDYYNGTSTIVGTDTAGTVSLVRSTQDFLTIQSPAQADVTFAVAYATTPIVVLQAPAQPFDAQWTAINVTTTGFRINMAANAFGAGAHVAQTVTIQYHVLA